MNLHAMGAERTGETDGYACTRVAMSTDGLALVSVSGEVDFSTAPRVLTAANDALRRGARAVFIDLAGVTFFGADGCHRLARGTAPVLAATGSLCATTAFSPSAASP